ncbi:DUF1538 domain-containing protein [Bacillus aquiflavi]|uniref:DUF1538 domain-containing protein n=1 Tax=Bacillus aquiflavi TaxID=2672567 RepID=UPI00292DD558|nr:DUF1538 domain-containing protein [Bacillus aquiflavi]
MFTSNVGCFVCFIFPSYYLLLLFFSVLFLKLPKRKLWNIVFGMIFTYFGLAFFLQGVHIGFMPIGELIGQKLGELSYNWIMIPVGFVLGFVVAFAEPAVRVLTQEVDKATGGYISEKVMLYTLSIGVGMSIALAMLRIYIGFSLWYILVPAYMIAFILTFFSKKNFISIAFDSGGVTTGPMTVTFILSMAVGVASEMEGRNPLTDGFGMIAVVAIAPIISVLILGLLFQKKEEDSKHVRSKA